MNATDVIAAIRRRYMPEGQVPEYVLIEQVRNQQGFGYAKGMPVRTFDALMVGLWESRGHPVHGFEVKVSRADWRRELVAPDKADPLVRHVHFWWVAAPKGIVDPLTLPLGWGLQEVDANGRAKTVAEALRREAEPPSWTMLAAILKRAAEQVTPHADLSREYRRGYDIGLAKGLETATERVERAERGEQHALSVIRDFEVAAGVSIRWSTDRARTTGLALRMSLADPNGPVERLVRIREQMERFLRDTDREVAPPVPEEAST